MEQVSLPIPTPRKLPLSPPASSSRISKKPVPLPRTTVAIPEPPQSSPPSSPDMDSLTRRIKSASSNVQRKREAVVEGTRHVSSKIEKSVKNMLNKRQSALSRLDSSTSPEDSPAGAKAERCTSLPAEDIFHSISFMSPLDAQKFDHDGLNLDRSPSLDSLPPPEYPPPPLPDELYDEVTSNYSGSLSFGESFEESVLRSLSMCEGSESNFSDESERKEKEHEASKKAARCDSWAFYGTVNIAAKKPERRDYENVAITPQRVVDNVYTTTPSRVSFSSTEVTDSSEDKRSGRAESYEASDSSSEGKKSGRPESFASSVSISNDMYDTWEPRLPAKCPIRRPSKSVIIEFDPLYENVPQDEERIPSEGSSAEDFASLPEVPERVDSISECSRDLHPTVAKVEVREVAEEAAVEDPTGAAKKKLVRWTSMKKAIKAVAETNWSPGRRGRKGGDPRDRLERPPLATLSASPHSGQLFRSPSGGEKSKDFVSRNCQLSEGRLFYGSDKGAVKDSIALDSVLSLQMILDRKTSVNGDDIHCFEVYVSKSRPHMFGALCTTERRVWMQKILECFTTAFPLNYSVEFIRAGWCYLKEGVSGDWASAWILLSKRTLVYKLGKGSICEVDLRKARCIMLQDESEGTERLTVSEPGPTLLIDAQTVSLYLLMDTDAETNAWKHVIRTAAVDNGPHLADQQLTKDEIPTIIDKCINFIYAHGSLSEGIYRRSGSSTNITKLLAQFRQDAWGVQLSRQEYSEYDVAGVLKRFFRDLPEPLLSNQLHKFLCSATGVDCSEEEKVAMYRSLLEKLAPVNYVTTRRLISHLHSIHLQQERNLMPADNLAAIWGPTLMHVESNEVQEWFKRESEVVCDLITLYPKLFDVDGDELDRERRMMEVLERYHDTPQRQNRPSGDLKVWIYINGKDSGSCVNVTIEPTKDANTICTQLADRVGLRPEHLCLIEVICDGAMQRPLHHTEKVLDVVLRWGYWDEADRRANYLVITKNELFQEIVPLAKPPLAMCGELRFADTKSKSFKSYLFEFSQARLCYYKDKRGSVKLNEWRIEDIVWYIGYEPKRNPHTRWALTFIDKNKTVRTKENPFFGYTIAGLSKEEELKWIAALLLGEHAACNILPPSTLNLLQ
nr:PREDICTED: arf-GAP with Rho-GAP domain, ANK repeat and PH domain-containing protein 1 [Bemisia tabaci]